MNDNQPDLLQFPMQLTEPGTPVSDEQLICEVKMLLVQKLNRSARGQYELTEDDRQNIDYMNHMLRRFGYHAISFQEFDR